MNMFLNERSKVGRTVVKQPISACSDRNVHAMSFLEIRSEMDLCAVPELLYLAKMRRHFAEMHAPMMHGYGFVLLTNVHVGHWHFKHGTMI